MGGVKPDDKAIGEKILENYKRQLADRLARRRVEKTKADPSLTTEETQTYTNEDKFLEQRMTFFMNPKTPDPEELLAI